MGFNGELSEFRMVDLVQTIAGAGKTGKLSLSRPHGNGTIVFRAGKIVYATSSSMPRETLGSMLIGEELITAEQLKTAIETWSPHRDQQRLGEVLTDLGMVSHEDLQRVLHDQIEKNLSECLQWQAGSFEFELMDLPPSDRVEVDAKEYTLEEGVVAEHVLLRIAVQLDDLERDRATPESPAGAERDVAERRALPGDDHAVFRSHVRDVGSPELTGEVTTELLERAKELFARGILIVVREQQFDVVGGFGAMSRTAGDPISVRKISVPTGQPSIVRQVVETGEAYFGPMPFLPANRQLLRDLGGAKPTAVAALPVNVGGSVRLVFYGDHPRDEPSSTGLREIERLLERTGLKMEKQLPARAPRESDSANRG